MELHINNKNEILLSICIPTINRVGILEKTIQSIVSQQLFIETNLIELVISDNASKDETEKIVLSYCKKFPNKILYFKNEYDILDKNFEKCLSYARGKYLKLNNDTLIHRDNSLETILRLIQENIIEKPIIFFPNQVNSFFDQTIRVNNLEDLLKITDYRITWIGAFGIWKSNFDAIQDFNRLAHLQLTQVDIILRLIPENNILVVNQILFDIAPVNKKGGYDIITVFLENLFFIIEYNDKNIVTKKTKNKLKNKIINNLIFKWLLKSTIDKNYTFSFKNIIYRIYLSTKDNKLIFLFFILKYILISPIILFQKIFK